MDAAKLIMDRMRGNKVHKMREEAAIARARKRIRENKRRIERNLPLLEPWNDQLQKCKNILKPHQVEGVKFLWSHITSRDPQQQGCILADFMGLGKTLQVVCTLDLYVTDARICRAPRLPRCLVIVPSTLIRNWKAEFKKWVGKSIKPMILASSTSAKKRVSVISQWQALGGVLVAGYEMFRSMVTHPATGSLDPDSKSNQYDIDLTEFGAEKPSSSRTSANKLQDYAFFRQALLDPGPDVIVLDEGHRIRSHQAHISVLLKQVKTRRRVVLTGCPLQTQLAEYWSMLNFISPELLGPLDIFKREYETPIQAGQRLDSSSEAVTRALTTTAKLQEKIRPFVLRRNSDILTETLPPHHEYVVWCSPSTMQRRMFSEFTKLRDKGARLDLLSAYHDITMVFNHPDILRNQILEQLADSTCSSSSSSNGSGKLRSKKKKRTTSSKKLHRKKSKTSPKRSSSIPKPAGCFLSKDGFFSDQPYQQCENDYDNYDEDKGYIEADTIDLTSSKDLVTTDSTPSVPTPPLPTLESPLEASNVKEEEEEGKTLITIKGKKINLKTVAQNLPARMKARYAWAINSLLTEDYKEGQQELGGKALVCMALLRQFRAVGDRAVIFSRSLRTLSFIQQLLEQDTPENGGTWGCLRLDGAVSTATRQQLVNKFNDPEEHADVFLISTRAGGEGITLTGGNRVILFDVSFNPCNDAQAARRCYRYGQTKHVFIYRLVALGSLETVVFNRQIARENLTARVVDEKPMQRVFNTSELADLFKPATLCASPHLTPIPSSITPPSLAVVSPLVSPATQSQHPPSMSLSWGNTKASSSTAISQVSLPPSSPSTCSIQLAKDEEKHSNNQTKVENATEARSLISINALEETSTSSVSNNRPILSLISSSSPSAESSSFVTPAPRKPGSDPSPPPPPQSSSSATIFSFPPTSSQSSSNVSPPTSNLLSVTIPKSEQIKGSKAKPINTRFPSGINSPSLSLEMPKHDPALAGAYKQLGNKWIRRWREYDVLLTLDEDEMLAMQHEATLLDAAEESKKAENALTLDANTLAELVRSWEVVNSTARLNDWRPTKDQTVRCFGQRMICIIPDQIPPTTMTILKSVCRTIQVHAVHTLTPLTELVSSNLPLEEQKKWVQDKMKKSKLNSRSTESVCDAGAIPVNMLIDLYNLFEGLPSRFETQTKIASKEEGTDQIQDSMSNDVDLVVVDDDDDLHDDDDDDDDKNSVCANRSPRRRQRQKNNSTPPLSAARKRRKVSPSDDSASSSSTTPPKVEDENRNRGNINVAVCQSGADAKKGSRPLMSVSNPPIKRSFSASLMESAQQKRSSSGSKKRFKPSVSARRKKRRKSSSKSTNI